MTQSVRFSLLVWGVCYLVEFFTPRSLTGCTQNIIIPNRQTSPHVRGELASASHYPLSLRSFNPWTLPLPRSTTAHKAQPTGCRPDWTLHSARMARGLGNAVPNAVCCWCWKSYRRRFRKPSARLRRRRRQQRVLSFSPAYAPLFSITCVSPLTNRPATGRVETNAYVHYKNTNVNPPPQTYVFRTVNARISRSVNIIHINTHADAHSLTIMLYMCTRIVYVCMCCRATNTT